MAVSQTFALCASLCMSDPRAAAAQTPDILRERPTAHVAALGGAGVGAVGILDARAINPSLLVSGIPTTLSVGAFKTTVTDVSGVRLGVTKNIHALGNVSVDIRRRQIDDLLEDSVLAADPNLKVSDWGFQLGYARGLMGGRIQVGASWEGLSSRVFGTTGSGWTVDFGAAAVITSNLSVGIAAARLGPRYAWRDAFGDGARSPQGRTITSGLRLALGQTRRVGVQVVGDVVRALESAGEQGVQVGGEITLLRRVSLRGGYANMRGADDGISSAGLGLRLRNIRIDIARDRLGSIVGERTLLDFRIER